VAGFATLKGSWPWRWIQESVASSGQADRRTDSDKTISDISSATKQAQSHDVPGLTNWQTVVYWSDCTVTKTTQWFYKQSRGPATRQRTSSQIRCSSCLCIVNSNRMLPVCYVSVHVDWFRHETYPPAVHSSTRNGSGKVSGLWKVAKWMGWVIQVDNERQAAMTSGAQVASYRTSIKLHAR